MIIFLLFVWFLVSATVLGAMYAANNRAARSDLVDSIEAASGSFRAYDWVYGLVLAISTPFVLSYGFGVKIADKIKARKRKTKKEESKTNGTEGESTAEATTENPKPAAND